MTTRKLRFLTVDLPGHGKSPMFADNREPTTHRMAQSLWSVVDEVESNDAVVLLGHSVGGHVVLEAARQRPERSLGVALLAPVNVRPHRALGNQFGFHNVLRPLGRMLQHPAWRTPLGAFSEFVLKRILGFPRSVTREEVMHTQRQVSLIDFSRAAQNVEKLHCPVFHAFAVDDALIQPARAEE
eukprot:CAMPEP_0119300858 /NCGR_PEP_ID=MMETSP1333-20130426/2747_1 /TAXON_ID=418940 /ORGANISM="Scyphosphaera apsteinii, Strain RCC1455" /LENGTH=183 /DNA_ID=CAMNT_0007302773 /DNA_START=486 /DNA_END=1034 /DNA_ORIENTATION=+